MSPEAARGWTAQLTILCVACVLTATHPVAAQGTQARTYTLDQAISAALANHPLIRASVAQEAGADARVDEARTVELPALGVSAQLNRSTGNTVPGAFFLAPGFVPISGAPRGKTLDEGAWQTGVSAWASWDALALVRQAASVDVALAARSEAAAATSARRLDVAYRAADAFLLLLEAEETVRAAKVSVERSQVVVTITNPLVQANLRPGVDLARAQAEFSTAQTALARAEQARDVRRAQLAEAIGDASLRIEAAPGSLTAPIDDVVGRRAGVSPNHPDLVVSEAELARTKEAERAVDVQYLPRLDLAAAFWMRGSGLYQSPADGLVPDVPNWAAGATLTWALLEIPTIRARSRAAGAARSAAAARRDEMYLAVAGEAARATAILEGSVRVAQQTPAALAAARAAEQQAIARYRTGLAPVVDVADAERLLAQAEIDDAVARLEVRRAELLLGRASGDLGPFLARARAGGA